MPARAHPVGFTFCDMDFPSPAWVGVSVCARRRTTSAEAARHHRLTDGLKRDLQPQQKRQRKESIATEGCSGLLRTCHETATPIWHKVTVTSTGKIFGGGSV